MMVEGFMPGRAWRWRWGLRGPGRPPKHRVIRSRPGRVLFVPMVGGNPLSSEEPLMLKPDEFEALRLVYLEGFTQEAAAQMMGISRGTLWRALNNGRRKLVQAIVERRPLEVCGEG